MAFGIPFAFVLDGLFDEADVSVPYGCRSTASAANRSACGPSPRRHPYCHRPGARCAPAGAETRHDELRALDDSYVLFVDLPGFSREQVAVKVDDGFLFVTTADKTPAQEAGPVQAYLMERRRGGFNQRWKLPEDAMLDGIHAKLQNGELVVVIPKRTQKVPKHFVIPVLGADEPSSAARPNASVPAQLPQVPAASPMTAEPAQPPAYPADQPMAAEPERGAAAESVAHAPVTAEAEPAADAPATADVAAAPAAVEAPTAADTPTAPASAPLATVVAAADAAMPDAKEDDGSWEDVSDEEREAMQAFVRAKGKAPMEGPVLEEIERQEAERIAKTQHDADSD